MGQNASESAGPVLDLLKLLAIFGLSPTNVLPISSLTGRLILLSLLPILSFMHRSSPEGIVFNSLLSHDSHHPFVSIVIVQISFALPSVGVPLQLGH